MKVIAAACLSLALSAPATAGSTPSGHAAGVASFEKHSVTIKYGWLVRGPDLFDHSKTIFRIYLSSSDVGDKIRACDTMSCADGTFANGAFVDWGERDFNAYWLTLDGGHYQYSGGADASAYSISTNGPDRLAGKIHIDDSSFGGGKLIVEFDLPLARTFKK